MKEYDADTDKVLWEECYSFAELRLDEEGEFVCREQIEPDESKLISDFSLIQIHFIAFFYQGCIIKLSITCGNGTPLGKIDHPYMTGKVGMTITGNWFSNALKIYAPDVPYRVCAVPVPEGGRAESTTFGVNVFAIPQGAKNPELAALFIKFCLQGQVNDDN